MIVTLHPSLGFTEENQNHETPVQLGDGYLLAGRVKGSDRKNYSISAILRTEAEMVAVVAQFEGLVGQKFQWSPIPGVVAYRNFYCPSWEVAPIGFDGLGAKWEFSAKFEEGR